MIAPSVLINVSAIIIFYPLAQLIAIPLNHNIAKQPFVYRQLILSEQSDNLT